VLSHTQPDVVLRLRAAGCVFAEEEARLLLDAAATLAQLELLLGRRIGGEPLEHVLGWAEFCGLRVAVDLGVFVPRRRSEVLVEQAAALLTAGSVVVDLCCGSGALALALASRVPEVEVHAADIDPAAVACARRNLAAVGAHAHLGDLFDALPPALRGRVDVLLANVPYVPTGEIPLMPAEARLHEHPVALDGGTDGLDVLRRVAVAAPAWLAPGGHLLTEASERQAPVAVDVLERSGLAARVIRCEDRGATAVVATRR
jgi:release factor glutamine methyltransferase